MRTFNKLQRSLAIALYRLGAIQDKRTSPEKQGFKLKLHEREPDAPLSPYCLNLRTPDNPKPGPLNQRTVDLIGSEIWLMIKALNLQFNQIAGIPNAGDPLADGVMKVAARGSEPIPLRIFFHKEELGGRRKIASIARGVVTIGNVVLLIDDLITQADSKLEPTWVLEEHGMYVHDVVVLVDREQGGKDRLAQYGITLHAVFTVTELLQFYLESKLMPEEIFREIQAYRQQAA